MRCIPTAFKFIVPIILISFTVSSCNPLASPISTDSDTNDSTASNELIPSALSNPTRTFAPPKITQPTVTAQPFPEDELLWTVVIGEDETGTLCESSPNKGSAWVGELVTAAAQQYSNPQNATGQFTVFYSVNGRAIGFPEGVNMVYDHNDSGQEAFCLTLPGHIQPGEYSVQYFIDIDVDNPYGFPKIPEESRYLLLKVLPSVDFSKPNNNLLVFESNGLLLFNPDEPAITKLTNGAFSVAGYYGYPIGPFFSADGSQILYSFGQAGKVFLINTDGSGTAGSFEGYYEPDLSPDGKQIAMVFINNTIWIVNIDGSGSTNIGDGTNPQWSPVTSQIAYLSNGGELWLVNADGSDPHLLSNDVQIQLKVLGQNARKDFAFSTDGSKIVFTSKSGLLTIINLDGTNSIQIEDTEQIDTAINPVWSPDGNKIAFDCQGLCMANLSGLVEKLADSYGISSLVWSHDGTSIYFSEWHGGIKEYDLPSGVTHELLVSDFRGFNDISLRPNP